MHPSIVIPPRAPMELVLGALLTMFAVWSGTRTRTAGRWLGSLLATYLCGALAVLVLGHAAVGRGPLVVSSYAVFLVVGALSAWVIVTRNLRRIGVSDRTIGIVLVGCFVFGVLGARAASVASGESTADDPRLAGLGVFGAFACDVLFLAVWCRLVRDRASMSAMLDAGAAGVGLNLAVARIGCLAAGCCYGAPAAPDALLTIPVTSFAPTSPAGAHYAFAPEARIWATQLLEAATAIVIAIGCQALWARHRRALRPGAIIGAAGIAYGVVRFGLERLREDSPRPVLGAFTPWQVLSVMLVLGCLPLVLRRRLVST